VEVSTYTAARESAGDGTSSTASRTPGLSAQSEKAEGLGGTTIVPPTEIPGYHLTFAFFADPEGHVVGLTKGAVQ
jgi:predicted enzyme related to lactoylglutathione lyase